jgi:hypothetical protein
MSIISSSFKKNAASKFAKSIGLKEGDEVTEKVIEAWAKGFDTAEMMFVEER